MSIATPPVSGPRAALVATGDPAAAAHLRELLGRRGLETRTVTDGREALDLFGATRFDLVIADHELTTLSGLSVLEGVRRLNPAVPPMILLMEPQGGSVLDAISLGAEAVFPKAFGAEPLLATIDEALFPPRLGAPAVLAPQAPVDIAQRLAVPRHPIDALSDAVARRRTPCRLPLEQRVTLTTGPSGGPVVQAGLQNLGRHGMQLLAVQAPLSLHQRFGFSLAIEGVEGSRQRLVRIAGAATVRWVSNGGDGAAVTVAGAEFEPLAPDDGRAIILLLNALKTGAFVAKPDPLKVF
jgi:DNA-binding response OmpR family regulator